MQKMKIGLIGFTVRHYMKKAFNVIQIMIAIGLAGYAVFDFAWPFIENRPVMIDTPTPTITGNMTQFATLPRQGFMVPVYDPFSLTIRIILLVIVLIICAYVAIKALERVQEDK